MSDDNQSRDDVEIEKIRKRIKDEIKKEIKKEILEEIYTELKSEEIEPTSTISQTHKNEIQVKTVEMEPVKVEPVKKPKKAVKEKVIISTKVVLKMASHSVKYANYSIPRSSWIEVIGLLAGKFDKDKDLLFIEDAYPMGHGNAIYTEIKDYKNYVRVFNDIKSKNLFICGWYHSHPSYGLFMSSEDIGTQSRYQRLWKKSVALVVDPHMINGSSYGFEIFRADLKTRKWYKVPYSFKDPIDKKILPELIQFINPIVDGKALFLEYDET